MIIGFFGNLSGGKTVTLVKYAIDISKQGKRIISNMPLFEIDGVRYLPDSEFIQILKDHLEDDDYLKEVFYNSVFILDEITNLVDARRSSSGLNDLITAFMMFLGKLDCDCLYSCQLLTSQVDVRLREITNILGTSERLDNHGNPMFFAPRIALNPDGSLMSILIKVTWEFNFGSLGLKQAVEIYDPKPYYKYYLTRKIILLDRSKYLKK